MKLNSNATLQIQKPIEEVFEGIVNPEKMTKYFISESSGRLETGKKVVWKFPEFEDKFPIKEVKVENFSSISNRNGHSYFVRDCTPLVYFSRASLPWVH